MKSPSRPETASSPSARLPVSAFIICQDEEGYLENCIRSLYQFQEIIIVDSGSKDGTPDLVRRYQEAGWPIRFMHQDWLGYAAQKQFAMEQTTLPWCLNIDSDERLDEDFREELPTLLEAPPEVHAWSIHRRPYLIGYGYSPKNVKERAILRMVRRGQGRYDLNLRVHEGIVVAGKVRISPRGSLLHYTPLPIEEQILKQNKYSTLKCRQLIEAGKKPRKIRLVFNPAVYFLRLYFHHRLCRCGFPGFIQAMTGAVYSFLTEAKIYQAHAQRSLPFVDDLDGDRVLGNLQFKNDPASGPAAGMVPGGETPPSTAGGTPAATKAQSRAGSAAKNDA